MWRYLAIGVAAMLMATAGWFVFGGPVRAGSPIPAIPSAAAQDAGAGAEASELPDHVPEATPKTREEKRFGRYDKDRDGAITRDEYLVSRRKAYAKLDADGDGRLSFDEWGTKTTTKFATADADKSGSMSANEFATTAVKRKPVVRRDCPPAAATRDDDG